MISQAATVTDCQARGHRRTLLPVHEISKHALYKYSHKSFDTRTIYYKSIVIEFINNYSTTILRDTFLSLRVWVYLQPLDVIGPKAAEFGGITQYNDHVVVQSHSRSPTLVPSEKPYGLRIVINTNVHPISHRLQVIANYSSNLRF